MGKGSAPKPPNPAKTAAAQTQMNIDTALAEGALNRVNQVGPDGSLTYSQTGTQNVGGRNVPIYTATTSLSDAQNRIKGQSDAAQYNLAELANQQSGFLKNYMAKPFDGSNDATESRLLDLGSKRLNPQLDRSRMSLESRLANQGIKLGSTAYDRALEGQSQKENDAWNQLLLQGHGQAFSEAQAIRNQPLNEIASLLSGSQVDQPNFVNTPQSNVANTDYAGLVNSNYQNQLAAYQQKQQGTQQMLGGLFGLAGKAIPFL